MYQTPLKRAIKQVGSTVLYQLLYTGAQGEVFFFFKDQESRGKSNINLAILDPSQSALTQSSEPSKKVDENCQQVVQLTGEAVLA